MTDRKESASEETTSKPSAESEALVTILAELRALKAQVNALENEKNTTPKKTPSKPTSEDFGYELYADSSDDFISGAWPKTPGENANRRQTMFEKSVGEAEENATTLVMQGIQPKFEHIRLSYLSIGKVFEFLDAINEYEIANKIKLKVPTLVDKSVRSLIIARTRGLTESKFYALNNKQLFAYITVLVQPESKLDFKEKLERNVEFVLPPSYKPSATDYRPMYDALLIYRDRFRKVYEIMAVNNEDNVPQCKNKEGGLIKTFLDKIPYEYGARVMMTLGDAKYADIYAFLKAFFDVVEDHRSFYLSAMKLRQSFGGTDYRAKRFPDAKVQVSEMLFSNMEEEQLSPLEPVAEETESEEELDQLLAAMQSPQGSGKAVPACFKKVLHGSCDRPGCKFDHEESSVQKLRDHYIDSMQKLKNVKPKIKTEQSAYGRRPGSFSNIDTDAELELSCIQEELFLANLSTDSFFRAVHREGVIKLDVADLHISKALFDTGALSASYIAQDFVYAHQEAFDPYLQEVNGTVRLAAENHTVQIRQAALLTVQFNDAVGQQHSAQVRFYVLPGSSNQMVIGLPAIVTGFSSLFMEMMQSAVDEYAGDPSHTISVVNDTLLSPWSNPVSEEAPEDESTPLPCSFTDALHFMEMSPEEAKREYFEQIEEHVSPAFRDATKVEELLRSEKGVKAFVPSNWEGIRIPPLELVFKGNIPERQKPRARPVNPRLYENAEKEFRRLMKYFYRPSNSPIASCLVIAPKATKPFIRYCGDYVAINKYIETGHYPIPHVQHSLEKICNFPVKLDLDLVNAFHQVPLGPITSERLSVQTPWGQVAPKFMPEGIAPATFVLQQTVSDIFRDFEPWIIAIFDNLLVLAHNYDDAYTKLEKVLDRCIEFNMYLKFSKSWLGFEQVLFFGYICKHLSYELSDDRKAAIQSYPPPTSNTKMRSFLGASLFFKSFVPHFSSIAAPLHEMTKEAFKWQPDPWTPALLTAFEDFKAALVNAFAIYYPNYELPWVLRTDASKVGVGMVLFQIFRPSPESPPEYQPIMFESQKFSSQARNWTTIEQEAYGIYFGVKACAYYLRCKEFVLETDHANLQWIEASTVPKVIRWRVFLQSFNFSLRHIPGKENAVADWLSRLHEPDPGAAQVISILRLDKTDAQAREMERQMREMPDPFNDAPPQALQQAPPLEATPPAEDQSSAVPSQTLLHKVHGGRMGHHGARRTWLTLNKYFPGHRIAYKVVEDFVSSCAICQKDRLGMYDAIAPIYRTLKSGHKRKAVGVDTLTVTPADKSGMQYINVVVVHATKLVALYPSATKTALDMALALFRFFSTYGVYEVLMSDPGSDLMSEVVKQLTSWYGIRHVFSLVDRHESNGVEGSNKSILRHLKALVSDERMQDHWSSPQILCLVQFILNSEVSTETGLSPFHAHFGTEDSTYFKLPEEASASHNAQEFVRLLDENLRVLWQISKDFQADLVKKRTGNEDSSRQNVYQPGDLVLFNRSVGAPLESKLTMRFSGPFEVIEQKRNDVQCRHLCMKTVHTFHVERLKMYFGSREDAEKVAQLDFDQYEVDKILYWRGNPEIRTTMEFFIRFADGEERWVTWNKDLFDSQPYETFCRAHSPLFPLIYTVKEAQRRISEINLTPIDEISPGDKVFVDLRSRGGATWYRDLQLPQGDQMTYVLECFYGRWIGRNKRKILINCPVTREEWPADHYFVKAYGACKVFDPQRMILVGEVLCQEHPKIMPH